MKKYRRIFFIIAITIIILTLVGILACISLYSYTGEKELREFSSIEMQYFTYLIIFLIILFGIEILIALYGRKKILPKILNIENESNTGLSYKYEGIEPNQYAFIWFDISGLKRAKIKTTNKKYYLFVDKYDKKLELWIPINSSSVFDDLATMSKVLYFEYNFECDEIMKMI